jgi:hypothetical protein
VGTAAVYAVLRGAARTITPVPRLWIAMMIVLVGCLVASMVIAAVRLL